MVNLLESGRPREEHETSGKIEKPGKTAERGSRLFRGRGLRRGLCRSQRGIQRAKE